MLNAGTLKQVFFCMTGIRKLKKLSLSLIPRFMFKRPSVYIYFKAKKCTWNLKVLFSGEPADCINNQHWSETGLPDVFFQTRNFHLVKFLRALDWKMLIYFKAIWNILRTSGIFLYHLLHFAFIWYIFPVLVPHNKKNLATLVGNQSKHFEKNKKQLIMPSKRVQIMIDVRLHGQQLKTFYFERQRCRRCDSLCSNCLETKTMTKHFLKCTAW
jgi:hypothetical protein